MKKANPAHSVTVLERNGADDTFGWGVVFSDQTMENFRQADAETYKAITDHFAHWDDIDVHVRGVTITSGGHGFSGISRRTLLQLLSQRATELGEAHDDDWFRNPRAIEQLRAEARQPPATTSTSEALTAGARALKATLVAQL